MRGEQADWRYFRPTEKKLLASAATLMLESIVEPATHLNQALLAKLAPRQRQVAKLLCDGLIEKQVAKRLGITPNTVHAHVKAIHKRLMVESRGELVATLMRPSK